MAVEFEFTVPPVVISTGGASAGRYGYKAKVSMPLQDGMSIPSESYTVRDFAKAVFLDSTITLSNLTTPNSTFKVSEGTPFVMELHLAGAMAPDGGTIRIEVGVDVVNGKPVLSRRNDMINGGGGLSSVPATSIGGLFSANPTTESILGTVTFTYWGAGDSDFDGGDPVGLGGKNVYLKPPQSWAPDFDLSVTAQSGVHGGKYYRGISGLTLAIQDATTKHSATIAGKSISFDGSTSSGGTLVRSSIVSAGELTATATVTDSRGLSKTKTLQIPVYEHSAPTIEEVSLVRCDEDGEEADEGTIAMLSLAASPATDIATTTIASVSVRHREAGTTAWVADGDVTLDDGGHAGVLLDAAGEPVAFDAARQYEVEVTVTDNFGFTVTRTLTLLRAFMTMDFLAGGRGIAFGQPATREGFDCGMDAYFDPPIPIGSGGTGQGTRAKGMSALAYAGSVGTSTNWDALDPGIYTVASASAFTGTGAPKGVYTYGVLHCWKNGPDAVNPTMQVYMSHHGDVMVRQRWNGEFRTWTPASFTGDMIKLIGNLIHPVGSVYITFGSENPETMFGGTWEKVEGKFLLGSSSGRAVGATGGEETHKLTATEMPAHDHGSKSLVGTFDFADNITLNGKEQIVAATSGIASVRNSTSNQASVSGGTTGSYSHKKGVQINATHTHSSNGGNGAHNNMPPYIAVNIWRRKS